MKLKKDSFSNARGGNSKLIEIYCSKCGMMAFLYQKDGIGSLHRCYLNRIFEPEGATGACNLASGSSQNGNLLCKGCGALVGTLMQHSDGRLAFRLVPGAWRKKLHK